jgi:hypothetical protein
MIPFLPCIALIVVAGIVVTFYLYSLGAMGQSL